MKPRIWRRGDRWYCAGGGYAASGYGDTPEQAYLAWLTATTRTWRHR